MVITSPTFNNREQYVEGNAYTGFYVMVDGVKYSLASLDYSVVENPQIKFFAVKMYRRAGSKRTELPHDTTQSLEDAMIKTFALHGSEELDANHSILAVFSENNDLLARKFPSKDWEIF